MAADFQNGCYAMKKFLLLLLNLAELVDFSDLYIKLYVFDDAKSDSDLKKWIGWTYRGDRGSMGQKYILLHISVIINLECPVFLFLHNWDILFSTKNGVMFNIIKTNM